MLFKEARQRVSRNRVIFCGIAALLKTLALRGGSKPTFACNVPPALKRTFEQRALLNEVRQKEVKIAG